MKNKIKNTLIILGVVIATIIVVKLSVNSNVVEKVASTELKASAVAAAENTIGASTGNPNSNPFSQGYVPVISEIRWGEKLFKPTIATINGVTYSTYCIEPGAALSSKGPTKEEIYSYSGIVRTKQCGCASLIIGLQETVSKCYVVPTDILYTQDSAYANGQYGPVGNLYDVAYILSYYNYNNEEETKWNGIIQGAIWRSPASIVKFEETRKDEATDSAEAAYIYKQAESYQEYYDKIIRGENSSKENPTINPKDKTTRDNDGNALVTVDTDYDNQNIKVGPFKVSYTDQSLNDGKLVKFGGISDMYLTDEAGNRVEITYLNTATEHKYYAKEYQDSDYNKYVEAKKSYIANKIADDGITSFETYLSSRGINPMVRDSGVPNYFSIHAEKTLQEIRDDPNMGLDTANQNFEDYWDFTRYYPNSDEEFYVTYSPKTVDGKDIVGSVHLNVDFAWMKCEASFAACRTEKYSLEIGHQDSPHTHINKKGQIRQCHNCKKWTYVDIIDTQDLLGVSYAKRLLMEEHLEIDYKENSENTNIDTSMKLGGYVFTDIAKGKETVTDGVITNLQKSDDGVLTTSDRLMPNVEVTLYKINDDGSEEKARCKTLLATKFTIPWLSEKYKNEADKKYLIDQYTENKKNNKEALKDVNNKELDKITIEQLSELYQYNTQESINIATIYLNKIELKTVENNPNAQKEITGLKNDNDAINKTISEKKSEIEKIRKKAISESIVQSEFSISITNRSLEDLIMELTKEQIRLKEIQNEIKDELSGVDENSVRNALNSNFSVKNESDTSDTYLKDFTNEISEDCEIEGLEEAIGEYAENRISTCSQSDMETYLKQYAYFVKQPLVTAAFNKAQADADQCVEVSNKITEDTKKLNDEIATLEETLKSNDKKINIIISSVAGAEEAEKIAGTRSELDTLIIQAKDGSDYERRMNSTLTDENGYYEFRGLITTDKYMVKFTYNGQDYLPTEYLTKYSYNESGERTLEYEYANVQEMVKDSQYSTVKENEKWQETSKATEYLSDRTSYDEKFAEIGSSPHNYKTTNSLGFFKDNDPKYALSKDTAGNWYNETYSELELLGYKLTEDGKYIQSETQLIDGYVREEDGTYKIDENGNTNAEYKEGAITLKIKEFISTNKRYPDDNELNSIYVAIANENANILKQIQFIEDCKIQASTKAYIVAEENEIDQYPVYDVFTADDEDVVIDSVNDVVSKLDLDGQTIEYTKENAESYKDNATTYTSVYPGQLEINLGLWERQKTDMALRKDLYKAATKINGKTEVYNYNKRDAEGKDYWDIQVRMTDYNNYYGTGYTRELYTADYNTVANDTITNKLDVYVTYKITVRNQSSSILTSIPEVVDYFDEDYEYQDGLSWVTYQGEEEKLDENGNIVNENIVKDDEYYNMMVDANVVVDANSPTIAEKNIPNYKKPEVDVETNYDANTKQTLGTGYSGLYIQGLKDKKLASGESAYIYLTFKVKADQKGTYKNGTYLRDDTNSETGKENYAEINGYKTFYRKGTSLPNKVTKGENDIAGLIDVDSNPGNLKESDINEGNKYEKNFEDDTDRSKTLRLVVTNDIRQINGTVWEDIRNTESGIAEIGNGILDEKEPQIAGVTVKLYEIVNETIRENVTKIWNGTSWQDATTTTGEGGKYEFNGYIPGNYIVRFEYGDTEATVLKSDKNAQSYNGQDYKSTTYQKGIDDATKATETETAKYNYDIAKSDAQDKISIISDAKDIMSRREEVEKYSKENVTNSKAEILVSPNDVPKYNDREYSESEMTSLINQLIENTKMRAETGIINVEFEYNRSETDGLNGSSNDEQKYLYGNDYNGKYVLNNINLGLEQRPQAQLKTTKQITNVKVTLANGNTLFDASGSGTNVLWRDHEAHGPDKNNKYTTNENYEKNIMKESVVRSDTTKKGLVQLTMDEELMHGATIKITYAITIANIGEVDYKGSKGSEGSDGEYKFYYTGEKGDKDSIVTTTVNQIIDYVGTQTTDDDKATRNNLEFMQTDNTGWNVINIENLVSNNLINAYLEENAKNYNTIVEYTFTGNTGNGKALVPIIADNTAEGISKAFDDNPSTALDKVKDTSSVVGTQLVLSKTITSDNNTDDMTYNNMVEIVKTGNTVGRRMAYSVVGNQNPLSSPEEVDADAAEEVTILPPFGQNYIYYIIGTVVGIITIGGVILIIRKVLKK